MPTYNILIQHINNAKKYDFRYKNILEAKKTLRHLSEDILFSELKVLEISQSRQRIRKISKLLLMVDVYEEARNLCKSYREEHIPLADIDVDDERITIAM